MHALSQARRVSLGTEAVDVVGKLAVAAQKGLYPALQLVLEVAEGRVVSVAALSAGLEAGELVVRHVEDATPHSLGCRYSKNRGMEGEKDAQRKKKKEKTRRSVSQRTVECADGMAFVTCCGLLVSRLRFLGDGRRNSCGACQSAQASASQARYQAILLQCE